MRYFSILLCLFIFCQCKKNDVVSDPVLDRIAITSSNGNRIDFTNETTTQLTVTGLDQANQQVTIDETIKWEVNNDAMQVDENGLVELLSTGKSIITASVGSISSSIEIYSWDSTLPRTEIFISDAGPNYKAPWQILRAYDDGEYVEVFTDQNLSWPQDIVVLEDKKLVLVSNLSRNNITQYDITDGSYEGVFADDLSGPTRMELGPDGYIYVLQWQGDGKVKRYQKDGTALGAFTDVGVPQSIGMAWDASYNLYVSTYSNGDGGAFVRKFNSEGVDQGLFIDSDLQGATDIWFQGDNLMVNDYPIGIVKRFDASGELLGSLITGLQLNEGVAHLLNGNILIGNGGTSSVNEYAPNGSFIKEYIPSGTLNLALPNAVTVREVNR